MWFGRAVAGLLEPYSPPYRCFVVEELFLSRVRPDPEYLQLPDQNTAHRRLTRKRSSGHGIPSLARFEVTHFRHQTPLLAVRSANVRKPRQTRVRGANGHVK